MEEMAQTEKDELILDLLMARFEDLMERRPLLLNSVLLRQNPHNVPEWQKRVTLLEGKPREIIQTYTEAVQTIDPKQAVGKLYTLWVNFAKFYEENKQLDDSRIIFEKATHGPYVKVEELASVWCEWVKMELRHDNHEQCLTLLQRATAPPPRRISYHDSGETVQVRLHKSLKIWSLYADMEESFGTFKSTKAVYDRVLELKIATPQIVINYGLFLKENNYFEEAFKAYEKGISLFKWPNVFDIWNTYLSEFLARYEGKKLERTRDLFEQCIDGIPNEFAKNIYLLYAKMEEDYGMSRHSMAILDRATLAVKPDEQFEVFEIYLKKASDYFGITHCREIYEKAIDVLTDDGSKVMCLRFAELETKLGEVDRARAIYAHCSQMCDPRTSVEFWTSWKNFEVKHGNEDTLREMLRIKRSVQATFNTKVNYITSQLTEKTIETDAMDTLNMQSENNQPNESANESNNNEVSQGGNEKVALNQSNYITKENILFVSSSTNSKILDSQKVVNPNEMSLDDSDDENNDDEMGESDEKSAEVVKRNVPMSVFGSLITSQGDQKESGK